MESEAFTPVRIGLSQNLLNLANTESIQSQINLFQLLNVELLFQIQTISHFLQYLQPSVVIWEAKGNLFLKFTSRIHTFSELSIWVIGCNNDYLLSFNWVHFWK